MVSATASGLEIEYSDANSHDCTRQGSMQFASQCALLRQSSEVPADSATPDQTSWWTSVTVTSMCSLVTLGEAALTVAGPLGRPGLRGLAPCPVPHHGQVHHACPTQRDAVVKAALKRDGSGDHGAVRGDNEAQRTWKSVVILRLIRKDTCVMSPRSGGSHWWVGAARAAQGASTPYTALVVGTSTPRRSPRRMTSPSKASSSRRFPWTKSW
jgi:hypothetical protein